MRVKSSPTRRVSTSTDEAISALREEFIRGFRAKTASIANEFRQQRLAYPKGTLAAAMRALNPIPGGVRWNVSDSDEALSLRSGCWECLELWCSIFPHRLKAFVKHLFEMGHSIDTIGKELEDICVLISDDESRNWLACFCGDGNPAATGWRAPGWLLDWPDELEAAALLEATSNGRLDGIRTKEVREKIRDSVGEYLAPAKEAALNHAMILIAKNNNRTRREKGEPAEDLSPISVSRPIERGKFSEQVCSEAKRVRRMYLGGRSMAEIQNEHPGFAIWNVRESLSQDDRETFNHPRQWGRGYVRMILARTEGISPHTVTASMKAYRKSQRPKNR